MFQLKLGESQVVNLQCFESEARPLRMDTQGNKVLGQQST
jgi:hypothetical protein